MTISITEFKHHCLEILREVESKGKPVEISKHGKIRFRVIPVNTPESKPWLALQNTAILDASPETSVLEQNEFSANQ